MPDLSDAVPFARGIMAVQCRSGLPGGFQKDFPMHRTRGRTHSRLPEWHVSLSMAHLGEHRSTRAYSRLTPTAIPMRILKRTIGDIRPRRAMVPNPLVARVLPRSRAGLILVCPGQGDACGQTPVVASFGAKRMSSRNYLLQCGPRVRRYRPGKRLIPFGTPETHPEMNGSVGPFK